MYKKYYVEMITPERTFFKGDIKALILETATGEIGILAGHLPLAVAVKPGRIRFLHEDKWKEAACSEGFLEVRPDATVFLAHTLEWPEEIQLAEVRRAIEIEEERLRQVKSLREYKMSKANLARALARLRVRSSNIDQK